MTTVLDLPIERQKEIAIDMGFDSFEQWQKDTANRLRENKEFSRQCEEAGEPDMTPEERAHWLDKMKY